MRFLLALMYCLSLQVSLMAASTYNLVDMAAASPSIVLDIRYATDNNFLGFPVYTVPKCYLHRAVAAALDEVQRELKTCGLALKIFDGYRPLPIQQKLWDIVQDERYVTNPAVNKGRHTRGTAVDITLLDATGTELEMPSAFDEFSVCAHSDYEEISAEARQNRAILKAVMERHGFVQFPYEWWHFDWAGWQDDALYPPLDISFEALAEAL